MTAALPIVVCGNSSVDVTQPRIAEKIRRRVLSCLKKFPDVGEGVIVLDEVEHFFTYVRADDEVIEVSLLRRDDAEAVLNKHNLTTYIDGLPGPELSLNFGDGLAGQAAAVMG